MNKKYIFSILLVVFMMILCCSTNTYAAVSAEGFISQMDRFEIDLTGTYFASSVFKVQLEIGGKTYELGANCCNHPKYTPPRLQRMSGQVYYPGDPGYDRNVAAAMYYGYWGDGCSEYTGGDDDHKKIASTSAMISYYRGKYNNATLLNWDFIKWLKGKVEANTAPDNLAYFIVYPVGADRQELGGIFKLGSGTLKLKKTADVAGSLAGAQYGVYRDAECHEQVGTLTTNASGDSNSIEVDSGTYYVKEIVAPANYQINPTVYTVNVQGGNDVVLNVSEEIERVDTPVYKKLGATDYDAEIPLAGVKFRLDRHVEDEEDEPYTTYTGVSGSDGICSIDGAPAGTYTVTEVQTPDSALRASSFTMSLSGGSSGRTVVNVSKKMRIQLKKVLYHETVGKTDAKVSGAYFSLYLNAACTVPYIDKYGNQVVIGPTDANGNLTSGTMRTGTYYLKETTFPEGINPDEIIPGEAITYREKVYVASYNNRSQTTEVVTVNIGEIVNFPYRGRVQVVKYDGNPDATVKSKAEGAVLRLTLDSNPSVYYDATIDEYGYAEFINETFNRDPYKPYTLPYGHYTITEISGPINSEIEHAFYYIQNEGVFIDRAEDDEYRVEADEVLQSYLKLVKKDRNSGRTVALKGSKFKIWYCGDETQGKEPGWITQINPTPLIETDVFETNNQGFLYTFQPLEAGKYVIYEVEAPEGYYLQDNLRLPENEADLGNAAVSGQEVIIDKSASGLTVVEILPGQKIQPGDIYIEVELVDVPLTVDLCIHKVGEKVDGSTSRTERYQISDNEDAEEDFYTPTYKEVGLQGVGYNVYAVADTYTPDGILRYTEGQLVAYIETDENGDAVARKLYPGEYRIEEVLTPLGYLRDDNIPNVILENKDHYVETATYNKDLSDERQKIKLGIEKTFIKLRFSNSKRLIKKSIFGIYTKEPIYSYSGNMVIPANGLLDLVTITEDGIVESNVELPAGKYYVKELYASYPYSKNEEPIEFNLVHSNDPTQELVVATSNKFINDYDSASFAIMKISSSQSENLVINGTETIAEDLDQKILDIINELILMTEEEARAYARANIKVLEGAKYAVFIDEECKEPLYIDPDDDDVFEPAIYVTDEDGMITVKDVPFGQYYLKEIEAPEGYDLSDEILEIVLNNTVQDTLVYRILTDDSVLGEFITKTDIFTGEVVPSCVFEIKDIDGKVLVHSITDEEGNAYIPLDIFEDGETYYYVEIAAPDIYDINTEPHEFVAKFDEDGKWITEKLSVENIRKTREVIVRKLDAETAEPLEGCVFTIALIDEETGEIKVNPQTKEEIYLVENATTNEDGEYVIEKAPMGTYRFIEIKAPEGYELDEDLTGYEFTIDNDSPDTIIFEVTNTGDIPVIPIVCVALVCIVGIVFVVVKNKKK